MAFGYYCAIKFVCISQQSHNVNDSWLLIFLVSLQNITYLGDIRLQDDTEAQEIKKIALLHIIF